MQAVALKTRELIDQLTSIVGEEGLKGIQARGLPPVMERFCINRTCSACGATMLHHFLFVADVHAHGICSVGLCLLVALAENLGAQVSAAQPSQ